MLSCCGYRSNIQSWARDYDLIQSFAVIFIYIQILGFGICVLFSRLYLLVILLMLLFVFLTLLDVGIGDLIGCSLVGSLGALYSGVLLINLAISLFALVAIESSSQSLFRTYVVLLFSTVLIDVTWFILFTHEIWNISSKTYGTYVVFSVRLTLWMQITGFCVRLISSLLWVQMYRLGVSYPVSDPQETDFDLRNSFLSPRAPSIPRRTPVCDEALGVSIYDPTYYSSLFEDGQDKGYSYLGQNHEFGRTESTSKTEASQLVLDEEDLTSRQANEREHSIL